MDNRKHVDGCPLSSIPYEFASCGCLRAQAAKAPPTWETFRDRSYYDMWAVRMVGDRTFGQGVHVMTQAEAEMLRDLLNTTSQVDALRAEVERLRHIAGDLLQHIDWLTSGLPDMLENAALTDEEGLIGAAVDAANSARTALSETMP